MLAIALKLPEPPRKANYQDVLDAPENMLAQIIDGELFLHARLADPHVFASGELCFGVKFRFGRDVSFDTDGGDGLGDWFILSEPELRLNEDVLAPDIAGWRVDKLPQKQTKPFSRIVPDWVCEVLSLDARVRSRSQERHLRARGSDVLPRSCETKGNATSTRARE